MNFGDPDEFTTIPSDSPAMTKVVGPDDDAPVMVAEEDTEPYEPPAPGEESEPPEEFDEEYESEGVSESGREEEEEPEDREGLKEQVGEEENVENEPVNVESIKPKVIRAKKPA